MESYILGPVSSNLTPMGGAPPVPVSNGLHALIELDCLFGVRARAFLGFGWNAWKAVMGGRMVVLVLTASRIGI